MRILLLVLIFFSPIVFGEDQQITCNDQKYYCCFKQGWPTPILFDKPCDKLKLSNLTVGGNVTMHGKIKTLPKCSCETPLYND